MRGRRDDQVCYEIKGIAGATAPAAAESAVRCHQSLRGPVIANNDFTRSEAYRDFTGDEFEVGKVVSPIGYPSYQDVKATAFALQHAEMRLRSHDVKRPPFAILDLPPELQLRIFSHLFASCLSEHKATDDQDSGGYVGPLYLQTLKFSLTRTVSQDHADYQALACIALRDSGGGPSTKSFSEPADSFEMRLWTFGMNA